MDRFDSVANYDLFSNYVEFGFEDSFYDCEGFAIFFGKATKTGVVKFP
ncbi:hypothetical protein [Psychroserpens sp. Hel_I_66]|nr:hypothetical protein [Psychroserpens sp. Hel_I_66]